MYDRRAAGVLAPRLRFIQNQPGLHGKPESRMRSAAWPQHKHISGGGKLLPWAMYDHELGATIINFRQLCTTTRSEIVCPTVSCMIKGKLRGNMFHQFQSDNIYSPCLLR
jgi:hypothetical protein